ncbi:hypothetical protein BRD15_11220 [Halobacteriales archaeon SW_6_65_15]|nr:MAG: hypothetical protein BRD15_11220 [Halobacteriales archaeon SW_6_65_15]
MVGVNPKMMRECAVRNQAVSQFDDNIGVREKDDCSGEETLTTLDDRNVDSDIYLGASSGTGVE